MPTLGLETRIVDETVYANSIRRFRDHGVLLPRISELADPRTIPEAIRVRLSTIDPDEPHPLNLFRVHWYNPIANGRFRARPEYLELPPSLTGVAARIVVLLADQFPMIRAHKVLASYGCLAPRVITGQFDPNCYLYLSRASDLFDVAEHGASVAAGLARVKAQRVLVIGVATDFLFPIDQQRELAELMDRPGRPADLVELASIQGHDSFLVDMDRFRPVIAEFFA